MELRHGQILIEQKCLEQRGGRISHHNRSSTWKRLRTVATRILGFRELERRRLWAGRGSHRSVDCEKLLSHLLLLLFKLSKFLSLQDAGLESCWQSVRCGLLRSALQKCRGTAYGRFWFRLLVSFLNEELRKAFWFGRCQDNLFCALLDVNLPHLQLLWFLDGDRGVV
ncbi:hypothetical protein BC830DRAFT_841842 [Chytriomyces sp. MP71]|nr:hypothetical protein BC830DRAFT_841842 [Chytriomyces sp. MP71]